MHILFTQDRILQHTCMANLSHPIPRKG